MRTKKRDTRDTRGYKGVWRFTKTKVWRNPIIFKVYINIAKYNLSQKHKLNYFEYVW